MTNIEIECCYCKKLFMKSIGMYNLCIKRNQTNHYCSPRCKHDHAKLKSGRGSLFICKECGNTFTKNDTIQIFCGKRCAAIFNSRNKKYGTRRSKIEVWLETKLSNKYINHKILFNSKEKIKSELDIYFPNINLAFEINGIHHYKSIFGERKFISIQNNDIKKKEACLKHNIDLHIIDISKLNYFKENKVIEYFDKICNIIDSKLAGASNDLA